MRGFAATIATITHLTITYRLPHIWLNAPCDCTGLTKNLHLKEIVCLYLPYTMKVLRSPDRPRIWNSLECLNSDRTFMWNSQYTKLFNNRATGDIFLALCSDEGIERP